MSKATEALSIVDAIAEGRYDRFLLSIHLSVQHRIAAIDSSVRQQVLEEFAERGGSLVPLAVPAVPQ